MPYSLDGDLASFKKDWNSAAAYYTKAIQLKPHFAVYYLKRADAYFNLGHTKLAFDDANLACRAPKPMIRAFEIRGTCNKVMGRRSAAIADYTKIIELDPKNSGTYFNRAVARFESRDPYGALADYNKVVELDPKLARGYTFRGVTRYWFGDKKGAQQDFDAAKIDPSESAMQQIQINWVKRLLRTGYSPKSVKQ